MSILFTACNITAYPVAGSLPRSASNVLEHMLHPDLVLYLLTRGPPQGIIVDYSQCPLNVPYVSMKHMYGTEIRTEKNKDLMIPKARSKLSLGVQVCLHAENVILTTGWK